MRPAYPTPSEFAAAFAQSGLVECLPEDIGDALDQAKGEWESETDWTPYLSTGEVEERSFTAQGPFGRGGVGRCGGSPRLRLGSNLLSLESVVVDDRELMERRDYFFDASNGGTIVFASPLFSMPYGVKVKGVWGAVAELPDDVWKAVLLRAAWLERDTIARKWQALTVEQQKSVLKAKESGPVRLEYATINGEKLLSLDGTFAVWLDAWNRALKGRVFTQP